MITEVQAKRKLTRTDLLSLESYASERNEFRARAIAHKRLRTVHLGEHMTLLFEDRITVQYQIQEMLRIERIFEAAGIQEELDAYNPLIPDGHNLKATLLIEYPDPDERAKRLAELRGIEDRVFVQVGDVPAAYALADEDMDRSNHEKTSAVHFLRFELSKEQRQALIEGSTLIFGIDDPRYLQKISLSVQQRNALTIDLIP
jgi:Protein of unknown function (DUF3501)